MPRPNIGHISGLRAIILIAAMFAAAFSYAGDKHPAHPAVSPSPVEAARMAVDQAAHNRTLSPLEGVWQTSPLTILAIIRTGQSTYDIIMYGSDDLSIKLPRKVGSATTAARPGLYDAHIARRISKGGKLSRPANVALQLSDNLAWLEFNVYKKGIRVNLSRLLPYMFRFAFRSVDTSPQGLEGARRIYPAPYPTADNPLVL